MGLFQGFHSFSGGLLENMGWCKDDHFAYPDHHDLQRFYRTADVAYLGPDWLFVFVGRSVQQVKVHGPRVELVEIKHYQTTSSPSMIS